MPHDPFYTSPAWRQFRAEFIRAHPVCAVPGCGARTSHVDHVKSRRDRPGLALTEGNCQPFCHPHHSAKTARADGGFGNKRGSAEVRLRGCDPSGRPLDPLHPWNRRTGT